MRAFKISAAKTPLKLSCSLHVKYKFIIVLLVYLYTELINKIFVPYVLKNICLIYDKNISYELKNYANTCIFLNILHWVTEN